jgi:hypothetical protein
VFGTADVVATPELRAVVGDDLQRSRRYAREFGICGEQSLERRVKHWADSLISAMYVSFYNLAFTGLNN